MQRAATDGILTFLCNMTAILLGLRKRRNVDNLLPIIAISYCWLEAAHPDRQGRQLQLMRRKLEKLYRGRGLLRVCQDYGFEDMGVFFDWASIPQKDHRLFDPNETPEAKPEAERAAFLEDLKAGRKFYGGQAYEESRTDEEKAAMKRALHLTMDLWYAHSGITVVLLTELPDELPEGFDKTRSYENRGWTTFERCSAELGKSFKLRVAKWKLVIDTADESGGAKRRLPTTPERMEKLLESRHFTNGADKAAVLNLYTKTATNVLGTVARLRFKGMPLKRDDEWCSPAQLGEALNYCSGLKELKSARHAAQRRGHAGSIRWPRPRRAAGAHVSESFFVNRFGEQGIAAVCEAFGRGVAPKLQTLGMGANLFGDEGAKAIADAVRLGRLPESLEVCDLAFNDIGDEGAMALATAILQSGSKIRPLHGFNCIGLAGQSALLQALEASHGMDMKNLSSVVFNAPFYLPAFLTRAQSLGWRRFFEAGVRSVAQKLRLAGVVLLEGI